MRTLMKLLPLLFLTATVFAEDKPKTAPPPKAKVVVREIKYDGQLSDVEARFGVDIDLEVTGQGETELPLFNGEVAVLTTKLPANLRLAREGNQFRLFVAREGRYKLTLDLVAKINRQNPWYDVSFTGPEAAIGSVNVQASGAGLELQLLSGTTQDSVNNNGVARVRGFLGPDRMVSVRWSRRGGTAEVTRKALLTCDTSATVHVTPTVVKYRTDLRFDILQGAAPRLTMTLPATQALTKLQGEGVRDWQVKPEGGQQKLTVEFIQPVEKSYTLTLFSEQTVESTTATAQIAPPQPEEVERESGSVTVSAEDVLVETGAASGLRQMNATGGALAAYQFYSRPFALTLQLRRIEPVVNVADRVKARLEESRLLVTHALTLNVEKAGIYVLELAPQTGFVVADARGDGVEDWKTAGGKLTVNFSSRVLGSRRLEVQLEQALKTVPDAITVEPLRVTGAVTETAQIGAVSAPGLQLKTAAEGLVGLREVPIDLLSSRSDEVLAYNAEQAGWKLVLTAERMAPRITADVFNLITIGDGLLGGSATIRYAILNQGVQEFRVHVPVLWKNVEFTGPNIRRKELQGDTWVIGLQDKAWGGYTLVVTYDYQFDPHKATLPIGGIHPDSVERETGSVAITSAANLQLATQPNGDNIRRVDEAELTDNDRSLVTRPVLMAYKYQGAAYGLSLEVTRFEELPVLDAAADRTQLTTVLTEDGQMLTQASFMVKNNDRQFQTFTLPEGADFWACYVAGEPVKPEKNGGKLLVPLPRRANRDEGFAVDIVYVQKIATFKSIAPRNLALAAPETDMQTTYAEWELYVPKTQRLTGFGGNMIVARGISYGLRDAWSRFVGFYFGLLEEPGIRFVGGVLVMLAIFIFLVIRAMRRGWRAIVAAVGVICLIAFVAAMLMPTLSSRRPPRASEKAELVSPADMLDDTAARQEVRNRLAMAVANEPQPSLPAPTAPATSGDKLDGLGGSGGGGTFHGGVAGQSETTRSGSGLLGLTPSAEGALLVPGGGGVAPMVAGIRPIRIDIPRTGERFVFTKVLNVGKEPLAVRAMVMDDKAFGVMRGIAQALAFLAGLALVWWQIRQTTRSSLLVTFGLALAIGSVVSLLLSARLLGEAMIVGAPVLALVVVILLVRRVWRKREERRGKSDDDGGSPGGSPSNPETTVTPPVVAAIVVLLFAISSAQAQTPVASGPAVSILSATYIGTVRAADTPSAGGVAQFEAVLELESSAPNQMVRLFGPAVAVQEFSGPKGGGWLSSHGGATDARLVREGQNVSVLLPKKGKATLRLRFLVKLSGDAAKRQIAFGIPPALTSRVAVTLDDPEAVVEVPSAVSLKTTSVAAPVSGRVDMSPAAETAATTTLVEAVLGAGDRVELIWTPRVKRSAEIATTVFCQNASLVTFGGGVVNLRSVLDYQVTQGELRQLQVRLPAGQRLMRVEGEGIRTWKLDGQTVVVELTKGVATSYRLTVETEAVVVAPVPGRMDGNGAAGTAAATTFTVETPHALDVKRETGLVALRASEELGLTVEGQQELQKVDVEEFTRTMQAPGVSGVYRFLKPEFALTVKVEPVQPQIEAAVRNAVRISTEQIGLQAIIEYTIKRAGVFALRLALPVGYRVERVAGNKVSQWVVRELKSEEGGAKSDNVRPDSDVGAPTLQVLEVTLKERTMGAYTLTVDLARSLRELSPSVEVVGVQPLDTQKLSGFVSVSSEEGVQVKTGSFDGLTEVPAGMVRNGAGSNGSAPAVLETGLAFKLIPSETTAVQPGWKLTVTTEKIDSWVRAAVMNTLSLTETLISGRSLVRYEIQNAPTKQFRIHVPAAFKNVEITGPNIRRKDKEETTGEWRVELQNPVRGSYTLRVTWEQPWNVKEGMLELMGLEAAGVERETGALMIVAPPRLRLEPKTLTPDLLKADVRDLPEWAGPVSDAGPVLAYRYLRPGYKLTLAAQRFEEAEVLQALVDSMQLTTVVAEDGQMMTEMSLAVRNNARQYLEVLLPEGAQVWSAFVAGQPVRPSTSGGKLLLPMERSSGDATVPIELTYVGAGKFPRSRGGVGMVSPALDVPLKNARWELYLPPDYRYGGFEGSMKQEIQTMEASASSRVVQFGFNEYAQVESEKKMERDAEVVSSLSNARSQLAGGKVNDAIQFYNRAKQRVATDDLRNNGDLKQLEKDLRREQGRNLQQAQQTFVSENGGGQTLNWPAGQPRPSSQQPAMPMQYDEQAAEQQASKVQQAQEVAVAKALPLRLNLPKRGVHYSFGQVLQTETGKPMSVQFVAAREGAVGWTAGIGLGVASFVLLWWAVSGCLSRRQG